MAVSEVAPAVKLSRLKRWPWLKACVVLLSLMRVTWVMLGALGVEIVKTVPLFTTTGADVIVGRAPLKRYGGE